MVSFVNNHINFLNETVFLPFLQNENNKFDWIENNPLDCDDCRTAWICKKLSAERRHEGLFHGVLCKDDRSLRDCDTNFKKCK